MKSTSMPDEWQMPCLYSIENTVIGLRDEFPNLSDADCAFAYMTLKNYFKEKSFGKTPEEPLSSSDRRQALLDEILNALDAREEMEADIDTVNNPNYQPTGWPLPNLAAFYVLCFARLEASVKMWSKEIGKFGYVNYISESVL